MRTAQVGLREQEREARVGHATDRKEERVTQDEACGERWLLRRMRSGAGCMLMAARGCEACDGRASRKIFLRET